MAAEPTGESIRGWLENKGHICFKDISIAGKFPDIVCLKGKQVTAVTVKKSLLEITKAIGECLHYMQKANTVYIALPSKEIEFVPADTKSILKATGIGLVSTDPTLKIALEAKKSAKNNADLVKELKRLKRQAAEPQPTKNGEEGEIRQRIVGLLHDHPQGLTILSISKHIGMTRQTASRYVLALISEGIVKVRKVGPAKLCYLRKRGRKSGEK